MRTRNLIITVVLATAIVGVLIYVLNRPKLYALVVKLLGAPITLLIAIAVLVALIAAAIFSVIYGFGIENPLRRERRDRKDS